MWLKGMLQIPKGLLGANCLTDPKMLLKPPGRCRDFRDPTLLAWSTTIHGTVARATPSGPHQARRLRSEALQYAAIHVGRAYTSSPFGTYHDTVDAVAISPRLDWVAIVWSTHLQLLDFSGRKLKELRFKAIGAQGLYLDQAGRFLVHLGDHVKVWEIESWREVLEVKPEKRLTRGQPFRSVSISPQGVLIASSWLGSLHCYDNSS
jgi:hypothetical protein